MVSRVSGVSNGFKVKITALISGKIESSNNLSASSNTKVFMF